MATTTIDTRRAQLEQLERVRKAGAQREKARDRVLEADRALADAVIAARDTVDVAELARTLGLTRKAIYDLIARRENHQASS